MNTDNNNTLEAARLDLLNAIRLAEKAEANWLKNKDNPDYLEHFNALHRLKIARRRLMECAKHWAEATNTMAGFVQN